MYKSLNFTQAINQQLAVMDTSSIALFRENNMPILVFNINQEGNLLKAAQGNKIGTLVTSEGQ